MDLNLFVKKISNLDIDEETKINIINKYILNTREKYFVYNYIEARKRLLMRIIQNKLDNREVIQNNNKTIITETIKDNTKVEYNGNMYFKKLCSFSFNNCSYYDEFISTFDDKNNIKKKIYLKRF